MDSDALELAILIVLVMIMLGAFKASADELNVEYREGQ